MSVFQSFNITHVAQPRPWLFEIIQFKMSCRTYYQLWLISRMITVPLILVAKHNPELFAWQVNLRQVQASLSQQNMDYAIELFKFWSLLPSIQEIQSCPVLLLCNWEERFLKGCRKVTNLSFPTTFKHSFSLKIGGSIFKQ